MVGRKVVVATQTAAKRLRRHHHLRQRFKKALHKSPARIVAGMPTMVNATSQTFAIPELIPPIAETPSRVRQETSRGHPANCIAVTYLAESGVRWLSPVR